MGEGAGPIDATSAPYQWMSPTLLSRQPVTPKDKLPPDEDTDWGAIFLHCEREMQTLKNWRWSYWQYCATLAAFFLPERFHFLIKSNQWNKLSPVNDQIIDCTGTLAVETCASGMWSGFTNPTRPWIKLGLGEPGAEPDDEAKEWLEDAEQVIYTVMDQSNFYTEFAQVFRDLTVFGTSPFIIYEDFEDVIRVYVPCAGEYSLACGPRFSVDKIYREFLMTVEQIVGMFTLERCPSEVQTLWADGQYDKELVVGHSIEPNYPISGKGARNQVKQIQRVPAGFTWVETYWLRGKPCQRALSLRGMHERAFGAVRWTKTSNDPYGRGAPCMIALGDQKQVQVETLRKAEYIEKGVRPPMGADPSLKEQPQSVLPGHTTYFSTANGKPQYFPLFMVEPKWLEGLTADIKEVKDRINECLYVNVFMAITQMAGVQPRNELELTQRDMERLQRLGPVIELVENELEVAVRRIMAILERRTVIDPKTGKRRGMLKPVPQSMRGQPIKISFVSLMRIAQRSSEGLKLKEFLTTMGQIGEASQAAGVPNPIRILNMDETTRALAKSGDISPKVLFTPEEVAAHDQARAQAQQQIAIPQQLQAGAMAAKNLAQSPLGGNTALSAIANGGKAPSAQAA